MIEQVVSAPHSCRQALLRTEVVIKALGVYEIAMPALFHETPAIQDIDAIGGPQERKPMRDDDHRASGTDALEVVLDDALRLVVQGAGRLVEDQEAGIGDQGPGDGDALALAAREGRPAFTDRGVVTLREGPDKFVRPGQGGGLDDARHGQARGAHRDVVADRPPKEKALKKHLLTC